MIKRYVMEHDEYEMLVEYSEISAFNFKSKEYQEVKKDFKECKQKVQGLGWLMNNFVNLFRPEAV